MREYLWGEFIEDLEATVRVVEGRGTRQALRGGGGFPCLVE